MKKNSSVIRYLLTVAAGAAISVLIFLLKNLFAQTEPKIIFSILCDGFFVAGALLAGCWLLMLCISGGALDGFGYALHSLGSTHSLSKEKFEKRKTFAEYKNEREASPKTVRWNLLFIGAGFLAVAVVMYIIYRNI